MFNPGTYMDQNVSVERAFKLGCILGCVTEKPEELVKFLRKLSPYKITNAQFKVVPKLVSNTTIFGLWNLKSKMYHYFIHIMRHSNICP